MRNTTAAIRLRVLDRCMEFMTLSEWKAWYDKWVSHGGTI